MKSVLSSLFKVSSLFSLGLFTTHLYAASIITSPEEIVVLSINDQTIKPGFLKTQKKYTVNPGATSLSVRYQEHFEDGIGHHDIVKSDIVKIQLPALSDQQQYALKLVHPPQNYDDARKFAEQPVIEVVDHKGQKITQKLSISTEPKVSLIDGLLGRSVDVRNAQGSANKNDMTSTPEHFKMDSSVSTSSNSSVPEAAVSTSSSEDQQLIDVWKKASKAERQKFMSWLGEQ